MPDCDPSDGRTKRRFATTLRGPTESIPGAVWANQFEGTANYDAHERTDRAGDLRASRRRPCRVCRRRGDRGSIAGVGRALRERFPRVRIVLAGPGGSALFNYVKHDYVKRDKLEADGVRNTEGIGIQRVTADFSAAPIDDALRIGD